MVHFDGEESSVVPPVEVCACEETELGLNIFVHQLVSQVHGVVASRISMVFACLELLQICWDVVKGED